MSLSRSRGLSRYACVFIILFSFVQGVQAQVYQSHLGEEASNYNYFPRPDSSFLYFKEQYNKAVKEGKVVAQGTFLRKMGEVCFHLGQYPLALEHYLEAAERFSSSNEESLLAYDYVDIGILYYHNKDTLRSSNYFRQALPLFKKQADAQGLALTYGNIGFTFEKKQQYDSAQYYQQLALKEYGNGSDVLGRSKIYENIGSIYEDLAKYDSAMFYFRKALEEYQRSGEQIMHIEVLNNIGDIYRKTGHYEEALQYSRMAIAAGKDINELYQLSSGYRDVAKTFDLLHQDDSAFFYSDLSRKYLLEIYSRENSKQMAFLQVQDGIQKKNRDIEQLQNAQRMHRTMLISGTIIGVLLVVLGLVSFNRQKLKSKHEKATMEADLRARGLEEEKLKTQLLAEQLEKEKLDVELRNKNLEETFLKEQIELKTKELSTNALHVIQKNQLLEHLRGNIETLVNDDKRDQKKQMKQLLLLINQNFNNENYWKEFKNTFEKIHQSFFEELRKASPDISPAELRLICLLKMNMSSNDIATMLGISMDSLRVARYRLRKKLNLEQGENLSTYIQNI